MRGSRRRSLLPHTPSQRRYRIPPLIPLVGRSLVLVGRHPALYAIVASCAIALEWCVYRYFPGPAPIFASAIAIGSAVDAIVIGRVKGDVDGWSVREFWDRAVERLWAVVIVNFIFTYVTVYGIQLVALDDIVARITAIPILLIAASLVFSEAIAVCADEEQWWFLIVRALGTSIRTAWTGATLSRAITLFVLQYFPVVVTSLIAAAFSHGRAPSSSFWTDVPLGILFSIPLDVLIVLAFFDASGYAPKRTCDE